MAGSHVLAVTAEEGGIVDGKEHAHRGLVDGYRFERFGVVVIAYRVTYLETLNTHNGAYLAARHLFGLALSEPLEGHQVLDSGLHHRHAVAFGERHVHARPKCAARHLAHGDTPHVRRVFERGDEHLRSPLHTGRFGNIVDYRVEQRCDVVGTFAQFVGHPPLLGAAVHGTVVELLFVGIEGEHQVEHLLVHKLRTAVGLVHLVYHHNGFLAQRQRLLKYEPRLGHGPLESVHKQQHSVGHVQHALHLAPEIGVTGRVDDVYLVVLIDDRNILGENRDSPLPFDIVVVEYEFARRSGVPEQMSLEYHLIHQRGFAVVYMGDDGDVAKFPHLISFPLYSPPQKRRNNAGRQLSTHWPEAYLHVFRLGRKGTNKSPISYKNFRLSDGRATPPRRDGTPH